MLTIVNAGHRKNPWMSGKIINFYGTYYHSDIFSRRQQVYNNRQEYRKIRLRQEEDTDESNYGYV